MGTSEDLQYPRQLLTYMDGFLVSKTMFTACELGVFDLLLESTAPMTSAAIAEHLNASPDGVERLLCACVGLKLLELEMNNAEAVYRNTELSAIYLTKSSPRSMLPMMMYSSRTIYKYWDYLTDAVREGTSQHEKAFGISATDIFEALYRSKEEMLKFMHLMNSVWTICGRDVITAFDLSSFPKVCDLGGCSGALAKQCILANPNSSVTIYDLPKVAQTAKKHFVPPEESRIHFDEGDFFEDPIPQADLYILARIIHDWKEDKCLKLLSKINTLCKPGGGVLLVEALLNEDKSGPLTSQLYSLNMLVQTEGKERTASEYSKLLTAAGFRDIQIRTTGKIYDAILGLK
ncbi:acetylserotonin O-methyltransferase isoform X1 [Ambystoma mexicanum]|uniref:acetylserotonin O-methyltransferase isoform X1 n=1 Tax=Ambystoma mexicanum TaxID=8296 RepID=UPI0037E9C521